MAMPNVQEAPTQEQRRQFDAFLAALAPVTPAEIQTEPEWDGYGWTLWVTDREVVGTTAFDTFVDVSFDLAEKHGVEVSVMPTIVKHLDD